MQTFNNYIMKKALFFIVMVVFGYTTATAQDISFGLKFGVNLTDLSGDVGNSTMEISPYFGGLAEFMVSKNFGVQGELLYSMQGAKFKIEGENVKYKLNYMVLPILLKYYVADAFSIHAGPQVGYLMSAKKDKNNESIDVTDQFFSIDYGVSMGVSYHLDMGIFFNSRYYLGLSDIHEKYGGLESNDPTPEVYNNVIQFSVGYLF